MRRPSAGSSIEDAARSGTADCLPELLLYMRHVPLETGRAAVCASLIKYHWSVREYGTASRNADSTLPDNLDCKDTDVIEN